MRTVPFTTLFRLMSERPLSFIGLLFVALPVVLLFPMLLGLLPRLKTAQDGYDYEAIARQGTVATATIRELRPLQNVTVNGEHPLRITYDYPADGTRQQDTYQTFDLDKARRLQVGDTITVRSYQGQSAITGLENFRFPYFIFYLIPGVFMLIGAIFLLIGLPPVWKKFHLYRAGIARNGTLVSMTPKMSRYARGGTPRVLVDYYFTGNNGERKFDNATTTDFSILNEKKHGDTIKILVSEDESSSCLVPELENLKYNWGL